MVLFTWVTLSFLLIRAPPQRRACRARLRDHLGVFELLERVDGGAEHVVGVGGADDLGQDVFDSGGLEHGAHRAARDHTGTGAGRAKHHLARAVVAVDLVRDRGAHERHLKRFFLAWSLPLRIASGTSFAFAETHAHVAVAVTDDDQAR